MSKHNQDHLNIPNLPWHAGGSRAIGGLIFGVALSAAAQGQEAGFADDFSRDSTRFTGGSFRDAGALAVYESQANGLRIEASTGTLEEPASFYLLARDEPGSFGIDVTQHASSLGEGGGQSTIFLEAHVFATQDAQLGDFQPPGTIEAEITYNLDPEGNGSVNFCVFEMQADGNNQRLSNFGGEFCDTLASFDSSIDVLRSLDIVADRQGRTITFSVDDVTRVVTMPGEETLVEPARHFRRMQLYSSNTVGTVSATLHKVRLAGESINFADVAPSFDRYQELNDVENIQRFASISNGVLRLTARATEDDDRRNRLRMIKTTDYIEAILTLSSESTLDSQGQIRGQIELSLYNDTGDGGTDGQAGDVSSYIEAIIGANGRAVLAYCLNRKDGSDGSSSSGLLDDGEKCDSLPIRAELDQPMRMSIALDRDASTVTFRVNDQVHVQSVTGPLFLHSNPFAAVAAASRDLADTVLIVDDLRTAENALTDTETTAGAIEPTAFPVFTGEPASVDSTLDYPLPDEAAPLDFIDDFSNPSVAHFGLETNEGEGTYGVASIEGAIRLESVAAENVDCCASIRLKSAGRSNTVSARLSLSSASRLPIDRNAHARISVGSQLWNDTQDYGYDDNVGDVSVEMYIEIRGDGERRARACTRVQLADGGNEDLDLMDGDNCVNFATYPSFDTEYTLTMSIDRETSTLRLSIDDEVVDVAIGGPAYQPAEQRIEVSNRHEGSSGRAVGLMHALSTDNFVDDFAGTVPLFAPYRPLYATQHVESTAEVQDGRLRMTHDSALGADNRPRFVSRNPSEYVAATLQISSESRIVGGRIDVSVGGHLYNDIADGGVNGNEGAVYASTQLVVDEDGSIFAEYCAFRSSNANFSDSTQIVGDDPENCPRFNVTIMEDTNYRVSFALNRENGMIVFGLDDQTEEHSITTGIFTPNAYFQGVRANSYNSSSIVAYADDLAFAANAVPLLASDALVGDVVRTGTTSDISSGGGCSISSGAGSGLQAPLILIALLFLRRLGKRRFA